MKLKKGDKIEISADYEWKYGEPSFYKDEEIWYLIININGVMIYDEDEDVVIKYLKTTYNELLKTVRTNGTLEKTVI